MCDERERLIGYVYDECDAGDRGQIDQHLETCATCREEIAGLRATRQDLLAWEVPDHGSVWRPFAPARLTPWYRDVPAWAMAAAAGLILFIGGIGGGVTAQVLIRQQPAPASTQRSQPTPVVETQTADVAAMRAELNSLEQRIMASMRSDLGRLDQRVSAYASAPRVVPADLRDTGHQDTMLSTDISNMWNRVREMETRFKSLQFQVQQLALAQQNSQAGR